MKRNTQFLAFIKKEFYHVLRDKRTLLILFGMPVVQILIFGFALTNEIKASKLIVFDPHPGTTSQQMLSKIEASRYFEIAGRANGIEAVEAAFKQGKARVALIFPADFEHARSHEQQTQIQIIADASDPNYATTITQYLTTIIQDYQNNDKRIAEKPYQITPQIRMLYNPQLRGAPSFVPGVIALVLMLVCVLMTAVSIVKEKETGTMEVLLVSPFKPILIIISKTLPYLFLSLINVASILLLSTWVLDVQVKGNVLLLLAESTLFIITCLSLGIFISIKVHSQQVALLISLMGMLLPTILFSGFMFPIENMPKVLQVISNLIPSKWFYSITQSIMVKGLGFSFIWKETCILLAMTLLLLVLSLKNFKTRLT